MAIPGVDIVVGTQDREKMLGYIEQYREERQPINGVGNIMKARVFEELDVPAFTDRTRASLKSKRAATTSVRSALSLGRAVCFVPAIRKKSLNRRSSWWMPAIKKSS